MNLYVDTESGTYFSNQPAIISTDKWDDNDWQAWEETMSDNDRCEYAYSYGREPNQPTPAQWCELWARA